MPKNPSSTATEPAAATTDTVEVTPPSTATDDSVIVAAGADPRPEPTEPIDPKRAGTGRVGRRNGRGTTGAAATSTAADGPADSAATSPDPGTLSVSDVAERVGGGAGDAVPDRLWTALLAHPGATAAELATAVGVARSTVSKLLATWAEQGRVTSAAGVNARAARQWTATPDPAVAAASTTPEPAAEADPSPRPVAAAGPARRLIAPRAPTAPRSRGPRPIPRGVGEVDVGSRAARPVTRAPRGRRALPLGRRGRTGPDQLGWGPGSFADRWRSSWPSTRASTVRSRSATCCGGPRGLSRTRWNG